MTTTQAISSTELWPEQWAIQVAVDADRVERRMRIIQSAAGHDNPQRTSIAEAVTHHLEAARTACRCRSRWRQRGVRDRWRGTSVEQAYRNLHSAKIFLVDILPPPEVAALVPEVCARMAAVLDRNDPRRTDAEKALQSSDPATALKQALEVSYDASDEEYVRLRSFRNIILTTAATFAVFVGLILIVVFSSPQAIPLCFEPSVTGSNAANQTGTGQDQPTQQVCPSGNQQTPTSGDILIIAGLGAVGGGLGALLAIRNLRGTSTPYGVTMALAVLKVPSGALIAVIGMLLLAGGFVPGLSNLDSQRQILAYALVFGYAQQLITRLADAQAQTIMNRLPSKDPEAVQPAAATSVQPVALTAEHFTVPKLVGQQQENARSQLQAANLRPNIETVDSPADQRDTVVETDPAAGTAVAAGSTVTPRIGAGPEQAAVPPLPGRTVAEATQLLQEHGLVLGTQTEQDVTDPDQVGKIVSSTLAADENVPRGTAVAVVVGRQQTIGTVPEGTGQNAEDAQRTPQQDP